MKHFRKNNIDHWFRCLKITPVFTSNPDMRSVVLSASCLGSILSFHQDSINAKVELLA
jgi:hypothetical protein